jgi:hypothetical protein
LNTLFSNTIYVRPSKYEATSNILFYLPVFSFSVQKNRNGAVSVNYKQDIIAHTGLVRNAYTVLVRRPGGKRTLGKPKRR